MGKKKVIKQTEADVLKETEAREAVEKKVVQTAEKIKARAVLIGRVYIQATYNNVIISITDMNGNLLAIGSAGALGFKGPKKSTPFAASRVAEALVEKANKFGLKNLHISVKGVGSGREAAIRVFGSRGFNILSIKDITPIPHNGCRPRKVRRV